MVVDMSTEQDRRLRLAESAAASAVLNGCDPEAVLARCKAGIEEAIRLNNRTRDRHINPATTSRASALDTFARSVGL